LRIVESDWPRHRKLSSQLRPIARVAFKAQCAKEGRPHFRSGRPFGCRTGGRKEKRLFIPLRYRWREQCRRSRTIRTFRHTIGLRPHGKNLLLSRYYGRNPLRGSPRRHRKRARSESELTVRPTSPFLSSQLALARWLIILSYNAVNSGHSGRCYCL